MSGAISSAGKPRRTVSTKLRARVEAAVEHMLALLDELDGDPDEEPSLGSPEIGMTRVFQTPDKRWHQAQMTQEAWPNGATDDREADVDGEEDDTLDHGELDPLDQGEAEQGI